jgi:hypothetical protein
MYVCRRARARSLIAQATVTRSRLRAPRMPLRVRATSTARKHPIAFAGLHTAGVPLGGTDGPSGEPGEWPARPFGPLAFPLGERMGAVRGSEGGARRGPADPSLHEERGMGDGDIGVGMGTAAPSAMAGRHAGGSSRRHEPRTGQLHPDARAAEEEPRVDRPAPGAITQHGRWGAHVPDDPFDHLVGGHYTRARPRMWSGTQPGL